MTREFHNDGQEVSGPQFQGNEFDSETINIVTHINSVAGGRRCVSCGHVPLQKLSMYWAEKIAAGLASDVAKQAAPPAFRQPLYIRALVFVAVTAMVWSGVFFPLPSIPLEIILLALVHIVFVRYLDFGIRYLPKPGYKARLRIWQSTWLCRQCGILQAVGNS